MTKIQQMGLFGATPTADPNAFPDLDALTACALTCQKCPLAATRTHVVIERGNRQARVMAIGEGPGQTEDETGLPFVGKAGQLLDKILAAVGFSEANTYICNVVKCRPPGNRVPTDEEMAACRPYLLEQIRLIDPPILLLLGATALRGVTGSRDSITRVRGQWRQWQGRWVMPLFHPSYLLRNQSRERGSPKWLTWQDIQAVRAKYEELGGPNLC